MSDTSPQPHLDIVEQGAQLLLLTLTDNAGIVRAKGIPRAKIASSSRKGVGLSPLFNVMCADSAITSSSHYGGPTGDMRLLPDLGAVACIDASTGLWWAPADQLSQQLEELPSCQRGAVRRQVARARDQGLEYKMAFELEFTLLSGSRDEPSFAHHGPSYGLLAFLELEQFMMSLAANLEIAGLQPELVHAEYGPGQVELSMAPSDPLTAADHEVLARLVVHRTAMGHGLRASFSPVTAMEAVGNGCHIHFLATRDGRNVFAGDGRHGISDLGGSMIGGLVESLPQLTALFASSVLSYDRLVPGHWSGAFACWGPENREAAVRYIPGTISHRDEAANCEVKIADSTCNPYLAAAAVLAMSMQGVERQTPLPEAVEGDPQDLDAAEMQRIGVSRLPADLGAALDALQVSDVGRTAIGEELLAAFVAVRRHDLDTFGALAPADRIAALRELF